jgi:hypothetical protein
MDVGGLNSVSEMRLFTPKESYRMASSGFGGPPPPTATIGRNPASGIVVYYSLKSKPTTDLDLEFFDLSGKSIRKFTQKLRREGEPGGQPTPAPAGEGGFGGGGAAPPVATEVGLNRFVWDTRYPDATRFPGMILWAGEVRGPKLPPGRYQVKLNVDGKSLTQNFEIKADPRLTTTAADYSKQLELGLKIRDKLTDTHNAIIQIRDVRKQVEDLLKRVGAQSKPINDAGTALNKKLTGIEETLYQTKNQSNQDPLNFPIRLNNKLAALGGVVGSAEAAPTAQSYAVYDELVAAIDAELAKLGQIMRTDVPAFNQLVRDQNIPAVVVK